MTMKCPQNMVKCVAVKGPCWLEVGPCQLPLQRLNHDHHKMLTLNTPLERSSGWRQKIRHFVLWENPRKRGLQIVRCFQVKIFVQEFVQRVQILVSSHTYRNTNITNQHLDLVLLASPPAAFLFPLSLFLQVVVWQEYPLANMQTMLEQADLFCGLSSPSVNAPWGPQAILPLRSYMEDHPQW